MKFTSTSLDKLAINLSLLCVVHCLALPVMLALLPTIVAPFLAQEGLHLWLIIAVVPTSIYSLALGCNKHRRITVFLIGLLGLCCMLIAIVFGHDYFGENGEKAFTLLGSTFIIFAHVRNFKLCQKKNHCSCPDN